MHHMHARARCTTHMACAALAQCTHTLHSCTARNHARTHASLAHTARGHAHTTLHAHSHCTVLHRTALHYTALHCMHTLAHACSLPRYPLDYEFIRLMACMEKEQHEIPANSWDCAPKLHMSYSKI